MRTHTTYTDIRRIMRLSDQGLDAAEISEQLFVDEATVADVIKVKCKKKSASKRPVNKQSEY